MTRYLALWFEAPLQAWGCDSRFDFRNTLDFPTKSGIFGLLLAASGDSGEQVELLERLAPARLDVFAYVPEDKRLRDKHGLMLNDFHMVGSGYDTKDKWQAKMMPAKAANPGGNTKLTHRLYLQDRVFSAVLALDADLADKFAAALAAPVFDLYLGRKCCVPSELVFQGVFDDETEAKDKLSQLAASKALIPSFHVFEPKNPSPNQPDAFCLPDVPVSFGRHKRYRDRVVIRENFNIPEPAAPDEVKIESGTPAAVESASQNTPEFFVDDEPFTLKGD